MRYSGFSLLRAGVLVIAAVLMVGACATSPDPARVYIVRHAEKMTGDDPALSAVGAARAEQLADLLENRRITRIFSTDTRRTRSTAAPLSERLGVPIEIYDHRAPGKLVARVTEARESVLIVGHSNTIADIASRFGVDPGPAVEDASEFDRLYVIALGRGGVEGEIGRYGERSIQ